MVKIKEKCEKTNCKIHKKLCCQTILKSGKRKGENVIE